MAAKLKSRKTILSVIALLLFLTGAVVLLYPSVCQLLYQYQADQLIEDYDKRMEETVLKNSDKWEQLYKKMVEYNQKLYEEKQKNLVDPFSYSQVDFSLKQFGFDEEMIGYLSISKMNIRLPIYLGASQDNLWKGATHLTQTSLPVGGVNTNAVIAAHRAMSTAAMFRDIESLVIGDEITITNFRETLSYKVAEIKIINPTEIQKIYIQDGRDLVTLITCHPYRQNYQRYVVYCERTPEE